MNVVDITESRYSILSGRRLLNDMLARNWKLLACSILFLIGVSIFTAALAASTRLIVNDVFVAENADAAIRVAGIVVIVAFCKALFQYANTVSQIMLTRAVSVSIQKRLYSRVIHNDVADFIGMHANDLMAKIRLYGVSAGNAFVIITNRILTEALTMVALFGVMFYQDVWMTLLCTLILPLIFGLVSYLSRKVRSISAEEATLSGRYFAIGSEALSGIKTVKSYSLEQKSIQRFNSAVDQLENRIFSIVRISSVTGPLMEFLGGLVIGAFVVYAAWQTITNGKTPGEFTAFITAFLMAYEPAKKISKYWVELQKSLVQTGNLYEILDAENALNETGIIGNLDGSSVLRFSDVSYTHDGYTNVLQNISLSILPGEFVAVVGKSGSGKSTLIDLIMRFYDPSNGVVSLGGHDLRDISRQSLKQFIALVSQDVFLFDGTIRENINDGNASANVEQIMRAIQFASLHDVILDLTNGIETDVGANGTNLSGGQKQRVGIARARVKNASLYIFDEATSALDAENERKILANLSQVKGNATILFVTHRATALEFADRVLFLDSGEIAGFDTYRELINRNEKFRRLFKDAQ
ncbi:MAG: ABC transporter ATP-binding protein [Rhodobacteraceae bacterium]|nr:ABC transporter ATP-binding protein [Paracoccaceae bacterium]NCW03441.1 ABC transporter ATP-binding protein [Paracoccaceae bacterium]NCW65594.1 ABC transporter ATP-binding protein [Paracoccaceae bacterium]NCX27940.1 ABC transporter ATP-binding protein [Rhodobacterales bacterium]